MTFKTRVASDVKDVFLNADEFAETITYTPHGGAAQTINAIVIRDPAEPDEGGLGGQEYSLYADVTIATEDVASAGTDDVLAFPKAAGGSNVNWNVIGLPLVPGDGTAHLRVFRREGIEKTGQGHRLPRG